MMKFPQSLHFIEDFKSSKDYALIQEIESIKNPFKIFYGNYIDFKSALNEHKEKSDDGSMWKDNYLRWEIQDKVVRLMYNFLSSAATLIDHTRKHNQKLHTPSDSIAVDYQTRIDKDFKNNLLCSFIIGFRNFLSHDKLPIAVSTRKHNRQTFITSFKIRKDSLEGRDWKSKAKQFKDMLPEQFDVEDLIDQYFNKVEALHEWYKLRLFQHHQDLYTRVLLKKKALLKLATEDKVTQALPFSQSDIERDELIINSLP